MLAVVRKQYEDRLHAKDAEISKREASLRDRQAAVAKAEAAVDEQVEAKLRTERAAIAVEEAKKARLALESDLSGKDSLIADLGETVKTLNAKLTTAQKAEADLVRKQRELDDAKREMDLTIEKRITEGLGAVESKARQRADDENRLKMAEKDKLIADAQRQVEEMKRKMEQGSQQLQGEVQELELEAILRDKFPRDTIEPVPKGQHGGDALHRVFGATGQACGTILWESKRTKNWSDSWLSKLREDQRAAKAEIAIIVTQVLPKGVETFDQIDGVWVTSPRCVVPVVIALRHSLVEIAAARQAGEGQQTKMELVYQYLTGPRFRHRIQAIVEKFSDMQEDLEKERKVMTKQWAKCEEQIRGVIESTAGMYGDLQGIAGKTLLEIDGLDVKMLEASHD
ncbi:MAG: DUF2130 domain-containing protein [Phycisphaeraceae bacterium]|nr:DUF2130 domain-containing protein [Phycisphaeraceae bacterium]MCW5763029.1 DUF2130 domain-containing protein [Phycisphaeraceae bacterium]